MRYDSEKRTRRAEALAESHLSYIADYIIAEYDHLNLYEQWEAVRELKAEIRPDLIEELKSNDLTADGIRRGSSRRSTGLVDA
jgi:hypothetical protein